MVVVGRSCAAGPAHSANLASVYQFPKTTLPDSVRINGSQSMPGLLPYFQFLPHRAHAVAENLGTEGPHAYFSVIRLLLPVVTVIDGINIIQKPVRQPSI